MFVSEAPAEVEIKNTSHGGDDFREAVIIRLASGERFVLKLADNDFTFPAKIETWRQCADQYRRLGYYCPGIFEA